MNLHPRVYALLNILSSWEPAENVEQCDRLLRSFWKHVGMDNADYTPGAQFNAQKWWIGVLECFDL